MAHVQKRARLNTAKGRNCHGVITETTRTLNGSRGRVPAWVGDAAGWGLRGEASTLGTTGCWQSARGRSPSHTLRLVAWCRPYRPSWSPFAFFKSDFKDETRKRGTGSARGAVRPSAAGRPGHGRDSSRGFTTVRCIGPLAGVGCDKSGARDGAAQTCASRARRAHTRGTAEASAEVEGGRGLRRDPRKDGAVISRLVRRWSRRETLATRVTRG